MDGAGEHGPDGRTLDPHERAAERYMDSLLPQMMKAVGVTEELKVHDQMAWVGLMNNCKARVEEIIFSELIYC